MNNEKTTKKQLKKAYKRRKWNTICPFKGLTFLSGFAAVIMALVLAVVTIFDNTVAAFVGGSFWTLENEDPNAVYFESDFASIEEMTEVGLALCQTVEAEGAVLLVNDDNALPLDKGAAVSCFSTSSVNLVYGGTGSGNIDASTADNLRTALEKSDFKVNETLWDFYLTGAGSEYRRQGGGGGGMLPPAAVVSEAPIDIYTDDVLDSVTEYGDAAIVVFSRIGGEGSDLEYTDTNYLALDENEKDLLKKVTEMKADGKIEKIVVLVNSSNALQMDFLKDESFDVDACLWIGGVGITGINAVAEILCGEVNPSGSLVDTYCYNNYSAPAMWNFTPTTYEGYEEGFIPKNASTYMIYQEGIYVGYKYYETRYEDAVMGKGNAGDYAYGDDVAFPFGYGLSYTDFEYSGMSAVYNTETDSFDVTVTVTNVGDKAGKETVQIYVQSPYTEYDVENKIEKASVALCGFAKTAVLEPGAAETVSVSVDRRELAAYDAYGAGTYILDEGDYYLTAATDSHNAINNILAAKGYTAENGMDAEGNAELAVLWNNPELDTETYSTSLNGTKITNQLSDADLNLYEGAEEEVTYLSRNDWKGTFPTEIVKIALTERMIRELQDIRYDPANYEEMEMPTLGADNGMQLYDMMGKDFDDPAWQTLLDQLTFDEMVVMIGDSFHWRMPIESVNAPGSRDENGPQGLTASLFGDGAVEIAATAFTSEDVMAATFNVDIMYQIGNIIGNNCLGADIACLYGPGNNIHRTPYGGRNFEYYSEDGFLSGKMSEYEVKAIQEKGVDVVMKHFALNDCEQDRIGLGVWVNEQAAREIYLKAFQAPFEKGDANGVMTAYTRWGTTWSGGYKNLMTNIMRGEWGNQGFSITDNVLTTYVNGVDGILAGVTTYDAMMPYVVNLLPKYENDAVIVNAMRNAAHHNLYALVNSSAMNGITEDTVVHLRELKITTTVRTALIVTVIIFVACLVLWILRARKFRTTEEYRTFKAFKKNGTLPAPAEEAKEEEPVQEPAEPSADNE